MGTGVNSTYLVRHREARTECTNLRAHGGRFLRSALGSHDAVEPCRDLDHFGFLEATRREGGGAKTKTTGHHWGARVVRDAILVADDSSGFEPLLGVGAREVRAALTKVNEHQMVVGAARAQAVVALDQFCCERLGIGDHLLAVNGELRLQRLAKCNGFRGDDVHERTALTSREYFAIKLGGDFRIVAENQPAARSAQGLVRGGGDHMRVREWTGMNAGCNQTSDVRDVRHQVGADRISNSAETCEIDHARVRAVSTDDELRLGFQRDLLNGVVIKQLGRWIEPVLGDLVEGAAEVWLEAVAQVTTALDWQAEDQITWIKECHERRDVGVGAAVRLHVGEPTLEELLGALAGDVFDLVVKLTAAVIALAGVALGVLVGQPTAGRVHHGGRDMIFAGDEFKRARLTVGFLGHERSDVGILRGDKVHQLAGHGIKRGGRGER